MDLHLKPHHHTVHFASELQRVYIPSDALRIRERSFSNGCFTYITDLMYNPNEKTFLGKTKEKWLFIFLGVMVTVLLLLFVFNLFQQTVHAAASEFTYTQRNGTGEYYVIKRKLSSEEGDKF